MYFTNREKAAINRLAKAMIFIDGEIAAEEVLLSAMFDAKFGIDAEMGDNMQLDDALNVVAALSAEEKKLICAYLGTIMAIDDDIDTKEHFFWSLLSDRCNFPEMSIASAKNIFESYM